MKLETGRLPGLAVNAATDESKHKPKGEQVDDKTRRSLAFFALENYLEAQNEKVGECIEDKHDQITDLITDLLHLAAYEHAADPEAITKNALMHYESERG